MEDFKIEEVKKYVVPFLKINGFWDSQGGNFENGRCSVSILKDGYAVTNPLTGTMYSEGFNIYWLIGVLTYYEYIDKNYKKQWQNTES